LAYLYEIIFQYHCVQWSASLNCTWSNCHNWSACSFSYSSLVIWNTSQPYIRHAHSINSFKHRMLDQWLVRQFCPTLKKMALKFWLYVHTDFKSAL